MQIGRGCTPPTNTYFSFDLKSKIIPLELQDNKTVRVAQSFEGWKSAVRSTLCAVVSNMTA